MAARSRYQRNHAEAKLEDLVIYTSTQTHSLGVKAGLVLGLQVRAIDVKLEDEFSLHGDTLEAALKEDAKLGRRPFILSKFHSFLGVLLLPIYYQSRPLGQPHLERLTICLQYRKLVG